jgi:hypothetical protein
MTENRIKAAVIGAFVADALSLGVHWVYNTGVIDKKFGRVEQYHDPTDHLPQGQEGRRFHPLRRPDAGAAGIGQQRRRV